MSSSQPNSNSTSTTGSYMFVLNTVILRLTESDLASSILRTVDIDYVSWLFYILYPVILFFTLPLVLFILLYLSSLSLLMIRHRRDMNGFFAPGFICAKKMLAWVWSSHGRIWHGYEVVGMEKIPPGAALIIYYHGVIPVDIYYFIARLFLDKNRHLHCVGDRFLFKIPGFQLLLEVACVVPGSVQEGVSLMKSGQLLSIAPGGVREALFADGYELIWGKRLGFAKIALQGQVPIIPVFTQNCREAFRTVGIARSFFRKVYEKTRLPIIPIYGGLPVKLRTIVGDPVPYDPTISAEELSRRVQTAIKQLILKHQTLPGNMFQALLDRFRQLPPVESSVS